MTLPQKINGKILMLFLWFAVGNKKVYAQITPESNDPKSSDQLVLKYTFMFAYSTICWFRLW